MPGAKGPHNIISSNLIFRLNMAIEESATKFIVFSSDQKIYLPELNHGLYADALAVCEKPEYWEGNDQLLVNPILVIEVLSKSTQKYDRTSKFEGYKTLPSFKEYVLVRQDTHSVETRFREEPGLWRETLVTGLDGEVFLRSLGCSISMKNIYKNVEI